MATDDAIMAVIKASRPSFRTPHDKIAFALHSAFLASGYTLIATGTQAFSDSILSSPPCAEVGIDGWKETEDSYGFVYSVEKGSKKRTVLVKCLVMGDYLVIDALSSHHDDKQEPISLQINVKDYDGGSESTTYADKYKNFSKLVKILKSEILQKVEDLPQTKSTSTASAPSRSEQSVAHDQQRHEPQSHPQSHDPYSSGFIVPPVHPGYFDDANPGPGAGIYPRQGPGMGGPMLIGPNDPRWFRPEQPGFPDSSSIVPPGARFDPIGPSGVPGFEPNRFTRNPRRPGTHPDLEPFGNPDFI